MKAIRIKLITENCVRVLLVGTKHRASQRHGPALILKAMLSLDMYFVIQLI